MVLDEVKEWLYGCTHCGTCKDVPGSFTPACPPGERYQLESYFASGKMLIARGVVSGVLVLIVCALARAASPASSSAASTTTSTSSRSSGPCARRQ